MSIAWASSTSPGMVFHDIVINGDVDHDFSPHNDVKLATIQESPVLQREGYTQNAFEASGNPVPTMEGA